MIENAQRMPWVYRVIDQEDICDLNKNSFFLYGFIN